VDGLLERADHSFVAGVPVKLASAEDSLAIASVHVINDIWKGDPSLLSWRDIVLLADRLGADRTAAIFDRCGLTWLLPYVDRTLGEILETDVPHRGQPCAPDRHDRMMGRRLEIVGWSSATALGRHPVGWALRLPTASAVAYLGGSALASPSYVRSKYGGYRAYWSLALRSLNAALRGADFRRRDVAQLTESLEQDQLSDQSSALPAGPTATPEALRDPSLGQHDVESVRVYVAFTPYHLILTRAMQLGYDGAPALLIIADEAGISGIIPEMLDIPGVFRIVRLRPIERHSQWLSASISRLNARIVVKEVRRHSTASDAIYIFNGARPEALALHRRFRLTRKFHYVEDGLNAYLRQDQPHVGVLKRVAYYCAYGAPHPHTTDLISMFPFAKYHYLVPELARPEAPPSKIEPIREQMFIDAVESLSKLTPDDELTSRISHLWFLAHSDGIADVPEYLQAIRRWVADIRMKDANATPGVKPHPRERNAAFLTGIKSSEWGVAALPHQMPAELMTSDLDRDCIIRSSLSTFVVTSRLLLPGRTIELESSPAQGVLEKLTAWDSGISR
jgi:hypothetical protein